MYEFMDEITGPETSTEPEEIFPNPSYATIFLSQATPPNPSHLVVTPLSTAIHENVTETTGPSQREDLYILQGEGEGKEDKVPFLQH